MKQDDGKRPRRGRRGEEGARGEKEARRGDMGEGGEKHALETTSMLGSAANLTTTTLYPTFVLQCVLLLLARPSLPLLPTPLPALPPQT